jgi:hypothetical protein
MEMCVLLGTEITFHNYLGLFWNWLFKYALKYAIRRVQEIKAGLKLNRTYQVRVYPITVNWFGDCINTMKNNANLLLATSKDDVRKLGICPLRRTKQTGRNWNKPLSQWHSLKEGLSTQTRSVRGWCSTDGWCYGLVYVLRKDYKLK